MTQEARNNVMYITVLYINSSALEIKKETFSTAFTFMHETYYACGLSYTYRRRIHDIFNNAVVASFCC